MGLSVDITFDMHDQTAYVQFTPLANPAQVVTLRLPVGELRELAFALASSAATIDEIVALENLWTRSSE